MTSAAEGGGVRSLVLNGLTATCVVTEGASPAPPDASDGDFYHELEIYRQLLRGEREDDILKEPTPPPSPPRPRARRRARTPDAASTARPDGEERRSKTLDSLGGSSPIRTGPPTFRPQSRPAQVSLIAKQRMLDKGRN